MPPFRGVEAQAGRDSAPVKAARARRRRCVCVRLPMCRLTSFMSGMDNVRNLTGNPLAGVDPHELVDTRPILRVRGWWQGGLRGGGTRTSWWTRAPSSG